MENKEGLDMERMEVSYKLTAKGGLEITRVMFNPERLEEVRDAISRRFK